MPNYDLWRAERASPTPEDRLLDRTTDPKLMAGFWRNVGPRTGYDEPVSIYTEDGQDVTIFQRGARQPQNTEQHAESFQKFLNVAWLKCIAVSKADWSQALETGFWPDGKAAKQMDAAEKQGVDLTTGGNNPPLDESLADQIKTLAESLDGLPEPKTKTEADVLSGLLDRMRLLLKTAEAERVLEKAPILQAGKDIDARWSGISAPGTSAYENAEARRKSFLKKLQKKLDEEAAAETARLRKAAEEESARIAEETAKRLAEQAPHLSEAEIEEQAQAAAEQVAPVEEVQAARATAGSAFGRSSGLRKVKRGKIVDMSVFVGALVAMKHKDVLELAQQLADRAAKAGMPVEGMTIEEVLE